MTMYEALKGPWEIREDGDANHYAILSGGRWLISFIHNGEALTETQRAVVALVADAPTLAEDHRLLEAALRNLIDTPPLGEPGHVDLQDAVEQARAILDRIAAREEAR